MNFQSVNTGFAAFPACRAAPDRGIVVARLFFQRHATVPLFVVLL
jgi:hypothetical protein